MTNQYLLNFELIIYSSYLVIDNLYPLSTVYHSIVREYVKKSKFIIDFKFVLHLYRTMDHLNVLELQSASRYYPNGQVHALRDISLKVQKNEYISIIGVSGSGKSTLLNILGCLDVVTSGKYILNGT